jgi:hypothetical protein
MTHRLIDATVLALCLSSALSAQEREDRTLLPRTQMTSIINEVSGERAMHHLLELVPYQRVRLPEEYSGPYRETRVIADHAKRYGFSNIAIETFGPAGQMAWQPTQGELWMTTPKTVSSTTFRTLPLSPARTQRQRRAVGRAGGCRVGRAADFEERT